ncbi:hypothetical protein DYB32_008770 [Aphanomyces invadans]|uniref:Uncharacterized protein n=1 Tax=Aphanomyces invadans TaxID=157072 RepID=A0A3R6YYP6_9STRA|nr:hypothetical protein DYB32_008770 [Aphanomyces invadans]
MYVDHLFNTAQTMRFHEYTAMHSQTLQYTPQSKTLPSLMQQHLVWSVLPGTNHESQPYYHRPDQAAMSSHPSTTYGSSQLDHEAQYNPTTSPRRYLPAMPPPSSSFLAPMHISTDVKPLPSLHDSISTPMAWNSQQRCRPMLPSIHVKEEPGVRSRTTSSLFASVINASAIQRRLAIERRNLKRKIVPRHHRLTMSEQSAGSPILVDVKNTKNRESAAAYREKRDRRMKVILAEIQRIQAAHPSIPFVDWIPSKLPKSERQAGESKEDYRRRTNRESAAGSREQQKEKLLHLTQQVICMREILSSMASHPTTAVHQQL